MHSFKVLPRSNKSCVSVVNHNRSYPIAFVHVEREADEKEQIRHLKYKVMGMSESSRNINAPLMH